MSGAGANGGQVKELGAGAERKFTAELTEDEMWAVFHGACERGEAARAERFWRELAGEGVLGRVKKEGAWAVSRACAGEAPLSLVILRSLLKEGAPASSEALSWCLREKAANRVEKIQALASMGDLRGTGANEALLHAASIRDGGGPAAALALLELGADPNASNRNGVTAFDAAMLRQDLETAEVLLRCGAIPHERWAVGSGMHDGGGFEQAYGAMLEKVEIGAATHSAPTGPRRAL